MKLISKQCPNCGNSNLKIASDQKYCECEFCGSKYAVDWSDSYNPRFNDFESMLQKTMTNSQFLVANTRLIHIEKPISKAKQTVEACEEKLAEAQSAHKNVQRKQKEKLQSAEMWFWGMVAVTAFVWLLVIFALKDTARFFFLLVALGGSVGAAALYSDWMKLKQQSSQILREAKLGIDEAKQTLEEACACLKDLLLEKEMCTRKVEGYRYKED